MKKLVFLLMFLIVPFSVKAQNCGDSNPRIAKPDTGWEATDNTGTSVSVQIEWKLVNLNTGTDLILPQIIDGDTLPTVAEGGSPLDLSQFHCSGLNTRIEAKAIASTGLESSTATLNYTFNVPAAPPKPPVLIIIQP